MAGLKHSRQREAIVTNLKMRKDHPTASMVYTDMRKEFPNISLGTVYRNLSLLADLGQIRKITTGTGAEHYDSDTHPHNHFICKCCGKVTDMNDVIDNSKIRNLALGQFDGRIDECNIQFYGVCGECLRKEEGPTVTSEKAV